MQLRNLLGFIALSLIATLTAAQSTTLLDPSTSSASVPAPSATGMVSINPGNGVYTYQGCYNETTGFSDSGNLRALSGSTNAMIGSDQLTIEQCFAHCGEDQYAGLEYGRECWCGKYLSSFTTKLPDTECTIPCSGAKGTACGGQLKLTLYMRTASASAKKGKAARGLGLSWLGATLCSAVTFGLAIVL